MLHIIFTNSADTDKYFDHYNVVLVWVGFGCFLLSCHTDKKKSRPALGYTSLLLSIWFLHKCGKIFLVEQKQLGSHNVIIFNDIFKTMKLIQLIFLQKVKKDIEGMSREGKVIGEGSGA